MSRLKIVVIVVAAIIIVIQFIPVNRTNPPVTATIDTPKEVISVFKKSCYNCHSHETKWPWYSYIAPVSWLVTGDVVEGRSHLNFSEWKNLSRKDVVKMKEEIWDEIEKEDMPLWNYTILHPDANLTPQDKKLIKDWSGE